MSLPICWLASYPKSGNTWVRFLLHQYLFGRAERSDEVAAAIPDVHTAHETLEGREAAGGAMLAKTHHRFSGRMPCFLRTQRVIYVSRHPRDVMWSALNYARMISVPEVASRITVLGYARNFIHLGGDPLFIQFGYGSLIEHATSWLRNWDGPRLLVRYEDLRRDPAASLTEMLAFLGVEPDAERVERAVADSSFERMRAMEEAEQRLGASGPVFAGNRGGAEADRRFMNAATLNRSLDEIAPGLDATLLRRFAAHLELLGYETSRSSAARTTA